MTTDSDLINGRYVTNMWLSLACTIICPVEMLCVTVLRLSSTQCIRASLGGDNIPSLVILPHRAQTSLEPFILLHQGSQHAWVSDKLTCEHAHNITLKSC